MKIICTSCDKILGERAPFDDPSKIYAKCTDCINKQKEEAVKFKPKPKPGEKQEIALENGLKGILWVPVNKKEKLAIGELGVSGKKFHCVKDKADEFQKHLEKIKNEDVEVTFLHSSCIRIDPPPKKRGKKEPVESEEKKDKSINYNCTVKVTKHYARLIFSDMAERNQRVIELLADAAMRAYNEEQKEISHKSDLAQQS